MLAAAEQLCGEYVWGVYDLLILPPSFPYGGMENPCLTFVTPTLLVSTLLSSFPTTSINASSTNRGTLVRKPTSRNLRVVSSPPPYAGDTFLWYGHLASLSPSIASVASEHHVRGPNQWVRVQITPRFEIHLPLLVKSSRILGR